MTPYYTQATPLPMTYSKEFRHKRLIARPEELLISKRRKRVILRLAPKGDDPRNVSDLDRKVAELTSWVVANRYWRIRFLHYELYTYLAYPGPCQVLIDVCNKDIRRQISRLFAKASDLPPAIPVPVAAYCLLQEAWNVRSHHNSSAVAEWPGIPDELAARRQIQRS